MPVKSRVEISDLEFERCLETIFEMWNEYRDTVDMAEVCGITEAQADYILICAIDADFDCRADAAAALVEYFGNKDWANEWINGSLSMPIKAR